MIPRLGSMSVLSIHSMFILFYPPHGALLGLVRREMIVQLGVEAKGGARWPGHTPMLAPLPFSVLLSDSNERVCGRGKSADGDDDN